MTQTLPDVFRPKTPYHPTLLALMTRWIQQPQTQRSLNFILFASLLHEDINLCSWALERGADPNAPAESWYVRFFGNLKTTVEVERVVVNPNTSE